MMQKMLDLTDYKSILCLNGDLPDKHFFEALQQLPVIAADGAANPLIKLGVRPKLIIGDLDSVDSKILESYPFVHLFDQNQNDFEKAMHYLREQDLVPAIIVGIHGGFLDHVLNNINIFMESDSLLYAAPLYGIVLRANSHKIFSLPLNSKISLIGMPQAKVSSKGLKWELEQMQLSFPGQSSCFNRTIATEIAIEIEQGVLLALIYEKNIEDAGQALIIDTKA